MILNIITQASGLSSLRRPSLVWAVVPLIGIVALVGLACGSSDTPVPPTSTPTQGPATIAELPTSITAPPVKVVATTVILGDLAASVGGDRVDITVLVPPGVDVHHFKSTPSQNISIGEADLIISNGLGLDGFLDALLDSSKRSDSVHVTAAEGLDPQPLEEMHLSSEDEERDEEEGEDYGDEGDEREFGDPHFWLDPIFAIHYVDAIRDGLIKVDSANEAVYTRNAGEYVGRLRELHREIVQALEIVPTERRVLVTFHDAYGYFGRRYGFEVMAFVPSHAGDVTPASIISVMELIRGRGIPAVFAEPQFKAAVLEQAAQDTGVKVAVIQSLPVQGAATYIELMQANAKSLSDNLK